ncbi:FkbM family methyltransferase [Coralliovum pocilloporae]|uniref:FkbM family methyltransferase n=1 Tax=Coralliovum pocilloporae TaxID=3066369 RepID=UPI00330726E4
MTSIKTFEKGIAFNASYREKWRDYLDQFNGPEIQDKYETLVAGMDSISRSTCRHHLDIIRYCLPNPLLQKLYYARGLEREILPSDVIEDLRKHGIHNIGSKQLRNLADSLELPEPCLGEMAAHSGLIFIREAALRAIKKRTVIDAGAYIGDTARLFQKIYKAGKVFAFEPNAKNNARMQELVKQWGAEKTIIPVQTGTGAEKGEIRIWGAGVGSSPIQKAGLSDDDAETISVTDIDSFVQEQHITNLELIKLDVEGSEFDTISGARETIKTQRPILLVSLYHTARDFFEIKPYIENMDLGYKFLVRKMTTDFAKEIVLICVPGK